MLHRNLRTGGYDLPGVESSDIPLIGYRPLSPDRGAPISLSGGRGAGDDVEPSQVGVFPPSQRVERLQGWILSMRSQCSRSHS